MNTMGEVNVYNLLLLTGVVYSLALGLIVLLRNYRNPVNLTFATLCFILAFVTLVSYHLARAVDENEVYTLLKLISLRMIIFPLSVHFYLLLTRQKQLTRSVWVYFLLYLFPAVLIFTADPHGLFQVHYLGSDLGWNFQLKHTPIGMSMAIFIFFLASMLLFLGISHIVRSKSEAERKRAWYVMMGFFVALILPVIFDIAIPVIPENVPQTSSITFLIGYSLIAHAIVRYELFSANPENAAEKVMQTITDAVVLTMPDGKITYMNPASLRLTGLEFVEFEGKNLNELFSLPVVMGTGIVSSSLRSNSLLTLDKRKIPVMISYAILTLNNNRSRGYAFIIHEITELKNLIDKVAESEKKYRMVTEHSSDIVTGHSQTGKFVYVSPAIQSFGYQTKDLEGMVPNSFIHKADLTMVLDTLIKSREELGSFILEYRFKLSDGAYRWVETRGNWIMDKDEKFLICNTRDISLRKEIKAQLQESEERYRILFDKSPDDIFLLNRDMIFMLVNERAVNSLGKTYDEVVGHSMIEVFPTEIAIRQMINVQKVFDTGEASNYLKTYTRTAKGLRWYTTVLIPVKDEDQQVISVMGIARDITEIEQAELKIRENEEKYRLFLENFQGIAFRMNMSNQLEFLYGDVFNITGFTIEEFMSGVPKIWKIIHPEDRLQLLKAVKMLRLIPNSRTTNECRIFHVDGQMRYMKMFLQNIVDENGKPMYIQAAMFDKTDYYNLQKQIINSILETEDRERARFAEDLHDELGPLLSSIRMYVNLIQIKTSPEAKEQLELVDFTKHLLDDAVQQAKNIAYNIMPEILSQYGVIPSIKSYCSRINKANEVRIEIQTDHVEEEERFDQKVELALYRVLKELIYNTMRHAKASEILIRFSRSDKQVVVEYSDNGIGFPVDEKINSGKTLGLRNIFHRVNSVGGSVHFSSAPGKGTRVIIKW